MRGQIKKDILSAKKYNLFDFIRINFAISPWLCIFNIAAKAVDALIPSVQILITAKFIDTAINIFKGVQAYKDIYLPLLLIILTVFYQYIYRNMVELVNLKGYMRLNEIIGPSIIAKRAKIEYKHMENNETQELISRTCEYPIYRFIFGMENVLSMADIPVRIGSILLILFTQIRWAGIVFFLVSIPLLIAALRSGKKIYESYKEANIHKRKALYIDDILTNRDSSLERYMFSYTDAISKKWREFYDKGRKKSLDAEKISLGSIKIASIITVLVSALIAGILVRPLGDGQITIGMFIALVQAVFSLQFMLSWELSVVTRDIANNIEFLKDLTKFMSLSETKDALEPADRDIYDRKFESIEFINVSFKYPGTDKYILKGLSMRMEAGLHYAFVGINGAGKTTIIKLLTGLYDDFEGEILINGKSIKEYSIPQLKAMFCCVYQDYAKYCISVKENIALGSVGDAGDEEINKAISMVDLEDTVRKLPDGINTNLGKIRENSSDISGGEWQKLAIARTLMSRSPVRILDEPTAALDAIAESNIYEMFDRVSEGKTTLLITHRLGAIKIADEIILIEDGKVSERGPHEKLMADNGSYARMYNSQRRWYM